jgi:hypothetical protein
MVSVTFAFAAVAPCARRHTCDWKWVCMAPESCSLLADGGIPACQGRGRGKK